VASEAQKEREERSLRAGSGYHDIVGEFFLNAVLPCLNVKTAGRKRATLERKKASRAAV